MLFTKRWFFDGFIIKICKLDGYMVDLIQVTAVEYSVGVRESESEVGWSVTEMWWIVVTN